MGFYLNKIFNKNVRCKLFVFILVAIAVVTAAAPNKPDEITTTVFENKAPLKSDSSGGGYDTFKPYTQCLVGMKAGTISDGQITATSEHGKYYKAKLARLDGTAKYGWCPDYNLLTEFWIQVDLLKAKTITGIVTQGYYYSSTYYVKFYKVMIGNDLRRLRYVTDGCGNIQVFHGNGNGRHHAVNYFYHPEKVRFVRIIPVSWHNSPVLKFDLLNC